LEKPSQRARGIPPIVEKKGSCGMRKKETWKWRVNSSWRRACKRTGSGPRAGGCLQAERRSCSTGTGLDHRDEDFQHRGFRLGCFRIPRSSVRAMVDEQAPVTPMWVQARGSLGGRGLLGGWRWRWRRLLSVGDAGRSTDGRDSRLTVKIVPRLKPPFSSSPPSASLAR
jgi:hypothetical protein